jgi:exonuclease I
MGWVPTRALGSAVRGGGDGERTRRLVGYQALADLAAQQREQVASARWSILDIIRQGRTHEPEGVPFVVETRRKFTEP